MKTIFKILCCAALLGALTGCSDDKDDNSVDAAMLPGLWLMTAEWDGEVNPATGEEEGEYDPYEENESYYLRFNGDGTGELIRRSSNPKAFSYHYNPDDGKIYWTGGTSISSDPAIVETLTEERLVLKWYTSGKNGVTYIDKAILKRIE
ncbi:hypothetical protein [Alistipes sp.]|uniref:hypothetical protein n=1 Tax=Alistipes sp. TaxID=1872444 RepID=UPI003AF05CC0